MFDKFLKIVPKRYYIIALSFICNMLNGIIFASMSIIVTDMTSPRKIVRNNETIIIAPEFNWTSTEKGFILGANPIGTAVSCICGTLIHKSGGVTFYSIGKIGEVIFSLATPLMVNTNVYLFIFIRFLFGFAEGLPIIGSADLLARWAPPRERVRLSNYSFLGFAVGFAINYPLCGFVIQNFGWRYLFYTYGALVSIWCLLWIPFVSDDPPTDQFISEKERAYLFKEIKYINKNQVHVPYKSIFTSVPVYTLFNEFFISTFTYSFTVLLPLYIQDVYDANIQTVALISGIPEFSSLFLRPLFACFTDYLRFKPNGYSIDKLHKLILFWGQSFTVVFFFLCAIFNNLTTSVIFITLARIAFGLSQVSYAVIVIDVAGQYAGFLQSVVTAIKHVSFFLNPIIIGLLVNNHTQSEWTIYFFLISFLTMYGVIVFVIFGSGSLQPWAKASTSKESAETANENIEL